MAKSQTDIGESSNLAQIAQTYTCNFNDQKFSDYVCILSVLAQVAIDNAKRRFDIDLPQEIQRIKKDMDIKTNQYPKFWLIIKRGFSKAHINNDLKCPMNYLYDLELNKFRNPSPTIPMHEFFIKHALEKDKKQCRKVEDIISKYSLNLLEIQKGKENSDEDMLLLRSDFDELIDDIRKIYISSNYAGLFSWLIDRAFMISPQVSAKSKEIKSTINKNRSVLLKVLYTMNSKSFLNCFKSGDFRPPQI